jgi:hypothetical protein
MAKPKPTKGEQLGFDQYHAKIRRDKGVEIGPANRKDNKKL